MELKNANGRDQREAADGWIIYPDAAIVIEAKSARFTLDTLTYLTINGAEWEGFQ